MQYAFTSNPDLRASNPSHGTDIPGLGAANLGLGPSNPGLRASNLGQGGGNIWMDGRTDGRRRRKFPICECIGHRPLWGCCPSYFLHISKKNVKAGAMGTADPVTLLRLFHFLFFDFVCVSRRRDISFCSLYQLLIFILVGTYFIIVVFLCFSFPVQKSPRTSIGGQVHPFV